MEWSEKSDELNHEAFSTNIGHDFPAQGLGDMRACRDRAAFRAAFDFQRHRKADSCPARTDSGGLGDPLVLHHGVGAFHRRP